ERAGARDLLDQIDDPVLPLEPAREVVTQRGLAHAMGPDERDLHARRPRSAPAAGCRFRRAGERTREVAHIRPRAVVPLAVDEEGGRAVHSTADTTSKIGAHLVGIGAALELALNPRRV